MSQIETWLPLRTVTLYCFRDFFMTELRQNSCHIKIPIMTNYQDSMKKRHDTNFIKSKLVLTKLYDLHRGLWNKMYLYRMRKNTFVQGLRLHSGSLTSELILAVALRFMIQLKWWSMVHYDQVFSDLLFNVTHYVSELVCKICSVALEKQYCNQLFCTMQVLSHDPSAIRHSML